ncbi:hypothetical protein TNCV_1927681 [Trichonephila clavipes]|nr:hypothetical protein TNCV_1927681 [Trichonephila clavipes]
MMLYSCSIAERSDDLPSQYNTLTPYRACWVTTGYEGARYLVGNYTLSDVYKLQCNSLNHQIEVFPWPPSDQHTAITGKKAEPAVIKKHSGSLLRPLMGTGLTPPASQTEMTSTRCVTSSNSSLNFCHRRNTMSYSHTSNAAVFPLNNYMWPSGTRCINVPWAVGSLVVRALGSRPEGLGSMPDATKYSPSIHGVEICGVAIYCPFGEFRRAKSYSHLYGAQGQRQAYLLPHATMNFVVLDLTTSDSNRQPIVALGWLVGCLTNGVTASRGLLCGCEVQRSWLLSRVARGSSLIGCCANGMTSVPGGGTVAVFGIGACRCPYGHRSSPIG